MLGKVSLSTDKVRSPNLKKWNLHIGEGEHSVPHKKHDGVRGLVENATTAQSSLLVITKPDPQATSAGSRARVRPRGALSGLARRTD